MTVTVYDLPLTTPAEGLWSQSEYVECLKKGLGFSAHGTDNGVYQWFHYRLQGQCVSLKVCGTKVLDTVYHQFKPSLQWIADCRAATVKYDRQ